jgi:hypothetical protein
MAFCFDDFGTWIKFCTYCARNGIEYHQIDCRSDDPRPR